MIHWTKYLQLKPQEKVNLLNIKREPRNKKINAVEKQHKT